MNKFNKLNTKLRILLCCALLASTSSVVAEPDDPLGQLSKKGGIFDGQKIPVLWESKVAMGQEKGTIQNMMMDYIENVKHGKIDGLSHNRWRIIGLN